MNEVFFKFGCYSSLFYFVELRDYSDGVHFINFSR